MCFTQSSTEYKLIQQRYQGRARMGAMYAIAKTKRKCIHEAKKGVANGMGNAGLESKEETKEEEEQKSFMGEQVKSCGAVVPKFKKEGLEITMDYTHARKEKDSTMPEDRKVKLLASRVSLLRTLLQAPFIG